MATVNKSIFTHYFTDSEGNIVSVKKRDEENQISSLNFTVQLEAIPDEFNRVTVIRKDTGEVLHEVNSPVGLTQGNFYVDYQTGKVTFSSEDGGKVGLFNYYAQGYELISCARIFDQTAYEQNDVIVTIQELIDAGRKGIDYLNSVGQGDALIQQLQDEVVIANTAYTTLKATIDKGDTLNTDLETNIASAETKNNTLINNLATVDSKNSTLTTTINNAKSAEGGLNTTIDTANTSRTQLQNIIASGNTLNNNLKTSITNANQALSDLNSAISSSDLFSVTTKVNNLNNWTIVVGTLAELELAITNIGRVGFSGDIRIKAGTYTITKSYELPAYTTVRALGDGEVIFKCNSSSTDNVFRNKLTGTETGYNGAGHITIEGITFDGYNTTKQITAVAFAHARSCRIEKCKFKRFNTWHNIELNGCAFCYIKNNEISDYGYTSGGNPTEAIQLDYCGGSALYPWTCKYDNTHCYCIYIEDNEFSNINGACIGNHNFLTDRFISELYVKRNHFYKCTHGVYIGNVNDLHLTENHYEKCVFGLEIKQGSGQNISGFFINDNKFIGLKGQTGYTTKDTENRFIKMECLDENTHAHCERVFIEHNDISECNTHGMGIYATHVSCNGNTVINCGKIGIFFYCVQAGTIGNNICQGNGSYNQGWRNYDIAVGGYSGGINSWRVVVSGNFADSICGLNGCTNSSYAIGNTVNCINVNGGAMVQK